jgi:hypothetical protein
MRIWLLLLGVAGCGSMRTSYTAATTLPATTSDRVRVFDLSRSERGRDLPDGVELDDNTYQSREIRLTPDFPTAQEPHRRVGDLRIVEIGNIWIHQKPDDWIEQLRAEAASHGANALVVLNGEHAVALWLSSAAPPLPSAEALVAEAEGRLSGYQPGAPQTVSLDRVEPLRFAGKKGTCYALVLALDAAASWSDRVRRDGLGEYTDQKGGVWLSYPEGNPITLVKMRAPVRPRSAAVELACVLTAGPVTVRLQYDLGAEDTSALGQGKATLVVLEKQVDAAGQKALERREIATFMFNTIPDHGDPVVAERDCVVCAGSVGDCRMRDVEACAPLQDCLIKRGHGTRVSYCLRER